MSWVVVLRTGIGDKELCVYGPITDEDYANAFAMFVSSEIDPAKPYRVYSPMDELLGWYRQHRLTPSDFERVEHWPPRHGDIWQDRDGNRWACQASGYLSCLVRTADDAAEEIYRRHGPLRLVYRPDPREEEAPF